MNKYIHKILLPKKRKYIYPLLDNGLSKNDLNQGIQILKSGRITMGKKTLEFEKKFTNSGKGYFEICSNEDDQILPAIG